ncbi:MAG: extracellular solute-binding protein [Anaerolineaceae bacterium]|nr:extracellular solute-binding protein [Anaerolineaceae bacterium]
MEQVTSVVEKVVRAEGNKEVRIARCGWLESAMPFDQQAAAFNALPEREEDQVRIVFDPAGRNSEDHVLVEMMASGEQVPWNGHNCMTPFLQLANTIDLGTVQPIDPFVETSQYQEARERLFGPGNFLPSAQGDCSYQGQWYNWPLQAEVDCLIYRKDYFAAVGQDEPPETMDELFEVCREIQVAYKDEEVWGFAPIPNCLWRYPAAIHQAFSLPENLFTEDGLVNILDEGWYEAMEWTKKCIDAGLAPPGWEMAGGWEQLLNPGKLAAEVMMHGEGTRGGMVFGYNKLGMAPMPSGNPRVSQPGTMFWFSCADLFKAAPYPQATTDFYIWALDPENPPMGAGVFKSGKLSAWYYNYENYLDEGDVTQNWALNLLPLLENATPAPITPWYSMENKAIGRQYVAYLQGHKSAERAMTEAIDEIRAQIAEAE